MFTITCRPDGAHVHTYCSRLGSGQTAILPPKCVYPVAQTDLVKFIVGFPSSPLSYPSGHPATECLPIFDIFK